MSPIARSYSLGEFIQAVAHYFDSTLPLTFPKLYPKALTMSIVRVDAEAPRVALEDAVSIAAKGGIKLSDQMATDFVTLVSGLEAVISNLPDDSCVIPIPDLKKYPRTDIQVPQDNDLGGWAAKVRSPRCSHRVYTSSVLMRETNNANRSLLDAQLPLAICSRAERSH